MEVRQFERRGRTIILEGQGKQERRGRKKETSEMARQERRMGRKGNKEEQTMAG